jgi:hypothetical protein
MEGDRVLLEDFPMEEQEVVRARSQRLIKPFAG